MKAQYPQRKQTLMNLFAIRPELQKLAQAFDSLGKDPYTSELLPIKYPVSLVETKTNTLVMGHVVTHLELEDWCWMKGYSLFTLDGGAELALRNERTSLT